MTDQHPITPPPELVEQWTNQWHQVQVKHVELEDFVAIQAAHWGADQELEACCEWLRESLATPSLVECFLSNRRPKPPSLKEQALAALSEADQGLNKSEWQQRSNTIRRALEQLTD